jgi:glycosyltransferase involved in cell wall biosynthesis
MEAMAVGVPVISTPVSGIPELIGDGVSGLLVPPRSQESLARSIERLTADSQLAETLRDGARRRIEEGFNLDTNVRHLARLFRR